MLIERIRILIVEDDPDMAELVSDLVEAEGWTPLVAPSAEAAAAVLDIDHVVLLEELQRLAQRRPGNMETLGELRLGRQLVARLQPLLADEIGDPIPELDGERARIAKGFVHRMPHWLFPFAFLV